MYCYSLQIKNGIQNKKKIANDGRARSKNEGGEVRGGGEQQLV
jgi:hypothetical protein